MKKSIISAVIGSLLLAGVAFAADKAVESKVGGCCQKAADKHETCKHPCCVEAAKAGNNCTKCGGSGPLAKKAEAKK